MSFTNAMSTTTVEKKKLIAYKKKIGALPRVMVFDLDNTLAESKQAIESDMARELSDLSKKTRVAVISGGKLEQLQSQVIEELPPSAKLENIYLLPTSGAALFIYEDHEWVRVYEEKLSDEESELIEEAIERGVNETGLVDLGSKSYGERVELRGAQVTFSALGQQAPVAEKKKWDPTGTKKADLREAIQTLLPEYDVKAGGVTSIDVTKRGINKAYGIRKLSEYLEIPISSMEYVGDELEPGGNDEVVKEISIKTQPTESPTATKNFIASLLASEQSPVSTTPELEQLHKGKKLSAAEVEKALKINIRGDVADDAKTLTQMSRDTSIFSRMPSLVVYPKDTKDVATLVRTVHEAKLAGADVSVTARSAGTCMSGGPLTTSIVVVFMKYMNKVIEVTAEKDSGYAITEPGVFYRDFEKATLAKKIRGEGLIMPSYPASRELCAMGGIVNNNSGGERTLEYGKTEDYIEEVEVVLYDGTITTFKALGKDELTAKQQLSTHEGAIYRDIHALIKDNLATIEAAKPHVSKNSAGYALWNVIDKKKGTFNLAKLICGAQGTLALMTKAKLRLVRNETHRAMLVIFLSDINILPEIVRKVLPFNPESFESYDDNTFKLAIKFMPQMLSQMGLLRAAKLGLSFLPEMAMVVTGGVPKLVLMAEFSADTAEGALKKAEDTHQALKSLSNSVHLPMSVKKNEHESEKYWIVRRESFALLRKNVKGLYAAPFIDDFVVSPETYPKFLPELNALLNEYKDSFIYTIAGHIGNGNFHIIPLMDLKKPEVRHVILELAPKVYELVIKYGGTTTGEHNDGIIRTPYLPMLFGDEVVSLFEKTKNIFDPLNIFNPGKKVHGTFADIERDMLTTS
jgi:HAD superfamily hydrolase (TIGR01484 family)